MIPQPLFSNCSNDLNDSWRKENPVNKKAIAQHSARGAPKKNSELSVYASESDYDSGYDNHNSKGTWALAANFWLFGKCSYDLKQSWRKENPGNKKIIAQHFARGAPKKNSELSVYASNSDYDSGYDTVMSHNSEGTWRTEFWRRLLQSIQNFSMLGIV